jgi:hypothetical protein
LGQNDKASQWKPQQLPDVSRLLLPDTITVTDQFDVMSALARLLQLGLVSILESSSEKENLNTFAKQIRFDNVIAGSTLGKYIMGILCLIIHTNNLNVAKERHNVQMVISEIFWNDRAQLQGQ